MGGNLLDKGRFKLGVLHGIVGIAPRVFAEPADVEGFGADLVGWRVVCECGYRGILIGDEGFLVGGTQLLFNIEKLRIGDLRDHPAIGIVSKQAVSTRMAIYRTGRGKHESVCHGPIGGCCERSVAGFAIHGACAKNRVDLLTRARHGVFIIVLHHVLDG